MVLSVLSSMRALVVLWPLNCDLCISNPLIMFILSPNPSVPCSCPSVQVSAASDFPVYREVAFLQLWPCRLRHTALKQPFHRQDGPLLRSPWQPRLQRSRLSTLIPPLLWFTSSQTPISASLVYIWIWRLPWTLDRASNLASPTCGRPTNAGRRVWIV